jgi:hypothetical protein
MNTFKTIALFASVGLVSACGEGLEGRHGVGSIGPDKSIDRGVDAHHLETLVAGIWVDPNGCDHWIIDDGVEGYLSSRLTPDGLPVCSGIAPPNTAVGPFKDGSPIPDTL